MQYSNIGCEAFIALERYEIKVDILPKNEYIQTKFFDIEWWQALKK